MTAVEASGDTTIPALSSVRAVLDEAGARILELRSRPLCAATKSDASPVTKADIESNRMLKSGLVPLVPGSGWCSEEEDYHVGTLAHQLTWIVDPLDGTKELLRGIDEVAISVALTDGRGMTVLGMVVNPLTSEGGGWSSNEALRFWGTPPTRLPRSEVLANAAIAVSRSELSNGSADRFLARLPRLKGIGSAAYKLLLIASGRADLMFSAEPKWLWDLAGGIALTHAAGMEAVRFDGKPLHPDFQAPRIRSGFVAGRPILVRKFLDQFPMEIAAAQALMDDGTVH